MNPVIACSFVEFDTSIICHINALFWLFSIARYVFRSKRICFWGTKYGVCRERFAYLHSILWRRARLWLELFASTVDKFFSRVSYLPSYVPQLYFEKAMRLYRGILMFLAAIGSSLRFWSSMYKFLSPLIVLAPQDLNISLRASLLTVLRVVYATVRLREWRKAFW